MIYILSNDASECARMLDDKSLGAMIRACAQELCNVHWYYNIADNFDSIDTGFNNAVGSLNIPMPYYYYEGDWPCWARECLANYNALLAYAKACCEEWEYRHAMEIGFRKSKYHRHKHHDVIEWCEQNKPDLPVNRELKLPGGSLPIAILKAEPFPLVMPEKYIVFNVDSIYKIKDGYIDLESRKDKSFEADIIGSYRAYYKAKLFSKKMIVVHNTKWTRREIPSWLGL